MVNLALFGASGGLGRQLIDSLSIDYKTFALSSKDVNVTSFDEVKKFFDNNSIDIVINLTGYNFNSFIHKYDKKSINEINKAINVNIIGNTNILINCLPKMRKNKFGRIILASSILSAKPIAGVSVYAGCKAFIDNLVKTTSIENLKLGITCNAIGLGYFDGGLTYKIPDRLRSNIIKNIPLQRLGKIEELQNTIKYLIDTEYISGTTIKINGGL